MKYSLYKQSNEQNCGSKKAFPSYRSAAEFNNALHSRGSALVNKGKKVEKLEVYRCISCKLFHIGHPPRGTRTRNRQRAYWKKKNFR